MAPDLFASLAVFRIIATEGSFTRAARQLGVTQSALSQQMKRLEEQLGLRLLARTTRSVAPTAAGTRLLAKLSPALDDVASEVALLSDLQHQPAGTIRISAGKHATQTILWPRVAPLMRRYPGIAVEISVDNSYVDIVAGRFDAGVRLGERLEKDMVAVPIGPPLKVAVVAAPDYLERHAAPCEPTDLSRHACISFRNAGGELSPWAFERDGHILTVAPEDGPIFNDSDLMVSAAVEGFGILYILEDLVRDRVADGSLVTMLEDWCSDFPGYYLYYLGRRQQSTAFTLLVEALRHPPPAITPVRHPGAD